MWKPEDIIVAGLTVTVITVMAAPAYNLISTGETLSNEQVKLLSGLMGGVISIISMYIGAKIQKKRDT